METIVSDDDLLAATGRPFGEWNDDDYDVLADATVVGRIMSARRAGRNALDVDADLWPP